MAILKIAATDMSAGNTEHRRHYFALTQKTVSKQIHIPHAGNRQNVTNKAPELDQLMSTTALSTTTQQQLLNPTPTIQPTMTNTANTPKVRPITVAKVNTKKKDVELDLHSLAEEDLKSLQKSDPFMYHSIPAVLEAERSLKEVDHSTVLQEHAVPRYVTRNSRVSFEKHASVIMEMEELLGDNEVNMLDDFESSDVKDLLSKLYFSKQ